MLEPLKFLQNFWSSVYGGILKKEVLTPPKEYLSNRMDELARESGDKQAKSQSFLLAWPFMGYAARGMVQI